MIDKFAERGLRSLAVARQVDKTYQLPHTYILLKSLFWISFICALHWFSKYLRTPRTVLVGPGNLSALCLSLIRLAMTVLKQLEEL